MPIKLTFQLIEDKEEIKMIKIRSFRLLKGIKFFEVRELLGLKRFQYHTFTAVVAAPAAQSDGEELLRSRQSSQVVLAGAGDLERSRLSRQLEKLQVLDPGS